MCILTINYSIKHVRFIQTIVLYYVLFRTEKVLAYFIDVMINGMLCLECCLFCECWHTILIIVSYPGCV